MYVSSSVLIPSAFPRKCSMLTRSIANLENECAVQKRSHIAQKGCQKIADPFLVIFPSKGGSSPKWVPLNEPGVCLTPRSFPIRPRAKARAIATHSEAESTSMRKAGVPCVNPVCQTKRDMQEGAYALWSQTHQNTQTPFAATERKESV